MRRPEPDAALRHFERDGIIACAVLAVAALVTRGGQPDVAAGVVAGGLLMAVSYGAIKGGVDLVVQSALKAGSDEGTGNEERRTENGKQGTGDLSEGRGASDDGTGNEERRTENGKQGTGDLSEGRGARGEGTGNEERKTENGERRREDEEPRGGDGIETAESGGRRAADAGHAGLKSRATTGSAEDEGSPPDGASRREDEGVAAVPVLSRGRKVSLAVKFFTRYALLAVGAYVMLTCFRLHPVGLAVGAMSPFVAAGAQVVRMSRATAHREHP